MSVSHMTIQPASAGVPGSDAPANLLGFRAAKRPWNPIMRVLRFIARAMEEQQVRRAAREVARFDDHMLRDLGITRSEIEYVVRHGRRNEPGPVRTIFDRDHRLED